MSKLESLMERSDSIKKKTGFDPLVEYPSNNGSDILNSTLHEFAIGRLINLFIQMQQKEAYSEEMDDVAKAFIVIKTAGSCPVNWKKALYDYKIAELIFKYTIPGPTEQ